MAKDFISLNLSDIENYLGPNVEKYGVSIRCTPSIITTDADDNETRLDGNTATFRTHSQWTSDEHNTFHKRQ